MKEHQSTPGSGSPPLPALHLTGAALTPADVESVARGGRRVELSREARERIASSRKALEGVMSDGEAHYGVNTGFGSLSRFHATFQRLVGSSPGKWRSATRDGWTETAAQK